MRTKRFCLSSLSILIVLFSAGVAIGAAPENSKDSLESKLPPQPYSLDDCIAIALENNHDVAMRGFESLVAESNKDIASSNKLPTIGLIGSYRHFEHDQRLAQPRRNGTPGVFGDDMLDGSIVLSMPIYTSGRVENEIEAATLLSESATHDLARTREELVFNVSNVFYKILAQKHIVDSLEFSKKTLKEHCKRVSNLLDVQKASRVDLLRSQVRLANVEQELLAQKNVDAILRRVLINLLGVSSMGASVDIKGELNWSQVDPSLQKSLEIAYKQRSDYLSMKKQLEAKESLVEVAKSGRYPIVSAEASYGLRNAIDPSDRPSGEDETESRGFVGVVVEIPLFEGGAIDARLRGARSKMYAQREALQKLKEQICLDVETAILNIDSSAKRVEATEKSIEQAKESLKIEREKYENGKGSITDVLDAQSALLDSQTSYYHALSDYNSAQAQWHLAIGDEK